MVRIAAERVTLRKSEEIASHPTASLFSSDFSGREIHDSAMLSDTLRAIKGHGPAQALNLDGYVIRGIA